MKPIERIMHAYELMMNLTVEQEHAARAEVERFLKTRTGSEEELAVQGLQFLRSGSVVKRRGRRKAANLAVDAS